MLRIASFFLLLFTSVTTFAATADTVAKAKTVVIPPPVARLKVKAPAVLRLDSGAVNQRKFDAQSLEAYKKKKEFQYREEYSGPSLWSRFWKWFWNLFNFDRDTQMTSLRWFFRIMQYVLLIGGVGALILLILKLSGINPFALFRAKPYSKLEYSESEENIHEIDFETDIEKAVSVNNYRLAVRLLYLRTLKQLSDAGLIDWEISKTNTHYVNELTDPDQREAFRALTRQFEYVWYGDFLINAEIYKKITGLFVSFKTGTV